MLSTKLPARPPPSLVFRLEGPPHLPPPHSCIREVSKHTHEAWWWPPGASSGRLSQPGLDPTLLPGAADARHQLLGSRRAWRGLEACSRGRGAGKGGPEAQRVEERGRVLGGRGLVFQAEGHLPRQGLGAFQEQLSPRPVVAITPQVSRLEYVQGSASTFPGRLSWVLRGPHAGLACFPGAHLEDTSGLGLLGWGRAAHAPGSRH